MAHWWAKSTFSRNPSEMTKRGYDEQYIKFGFTSLHDQGELKGQCILCQKVLGNQYLQPSKLKFHLEKIHPHHQHKDVDFFKRMAENVKRRRLDQSGTLFQQNKRLTEASYAVSLLIAQQKKPHTVGETLIKPCALKMARILFGEEAEKKFNKISLSNNTVQRRIADLSGDIKEQVIAEIKDAAFGLFSIQLDESTDVSSCSQLIAFVRHVKGDSIKEEFLFCRSLERNTRAVDVMEKVTEFFDHEDLNWHNLCGVCTDGAPAMLGAKSGFQALVRNLSPGIISVHCVIHRQALASKTLPSHLQDVLEQVIKIVNYVKSSALNSRLFKQLCTEMDSEHKNLLYYTKVRWLSKGNVVARVFELREEMQSFLQMQEKHKLEASFHEMLWVFRLAYLVDIFDQLNRLNLKLQGKGTTIIQFIDTLSAIYTEA
uniref:zinc finger BED domain-containing protein 5-like n=1 Tax=Myxine glutinosa TaxID=7769 RepID=UPI00358E3DDC